LHISLAHIKTLRKKIHNEGEPEIIVNIHGQGYRLNEKLIPS